MDLESAIEEIENETSHEVEITNQTEEKWEGGDKFLRNSRWIRCVNCGLCAKNSFHFKSEDCG